MHLGRRFTFFAIIPAILFLARSASADDLKSVLQKLDAAAASFHSTSANVEFDTIQTDPIPDTDVQTGTAYYERKGNSFQMAAHIHTDNKGPSQKTYIFSAGVFKISDTGKQSDVRAYSQAGKYDSYVILGFGASGKELQEKWDIKYIGTEKLDGVMTDKLELVAKDPTVRKNIPKVTIWLDSARAVSLKQVFDEGEGTSRVCHYTDIKVNQPLPKDAFAFGK